MQTVSDVNALFASTPIHAAAVLVCDEMGDGRAVVHIPEGEFVRSGHAPLHGGMIGLLPDVTSAMCLAGLYELGVAIPVSVDLNVRFFGQPKKWPVTAEATVVHKGKKILATECVVRDADNRQIARTTANYVLLEGFGDVALYKPK